MEFKISFEQLQRLDEANKRSRYREHGVPSRERSYMTAARNVRFNDWKKALSNAETLVSYLRKCEGDTAPVPSGREEDALNYFQIVTETEHLVEDSYGWGDADFIVVGPHVTYTLNTETGLKINQVQERDMLDLFVELRDLLNELRNEISRAHNFVGGDLGATRAYIEAFIVFLDEQNGTAKEEVPYGLLSGLFNRIKNTNWQSISITANNLASAAEKILRIFV